MVQVRRLGAEEPRAVRSVCLPCTATSNARYRTPGTNGTEIVTACICQRRTVHQVSISHRIAPSVVLAVYHTLGQYRAMLGE
eukprot:1940082-Rhodomonas_salina.3